MLSERLAILIDVNGTKAAAEFKKAGAAAQTELGKAEAASKRAAAQFTSMGVGMLLTGGVIAAGLFKATEAYAVQERAELKLQNTISNMPQLAGASAEGLKKYAGELQKVTTFGDEATIEAMALLGTFKVTEDQMRGMIPLVQDYAAKFDQDLNSAALQVGKALDGQIGALRRNGVSIDENLYKTDRYAAVQQALREQVGGFAEQEAQTFNGKLQQMKNDLGDVVEVLGKGAVGGFEKVLAPVSALTTGLHEMNPALAEGAGGFLAIGSTALIGTGAISLIVGQVIKARDGIVAMRESLMSMSASKSGLIGASVGIAALAAAVAMYNGERSKMEDLAQSVNDDVFDVAKLAVAEKGLGAIKSKTAAVTEERRKMREEIDAYGPAFIPINAINADHIKDLSEMETKLASTQQKMAEFAQQVRDRAVADGISEEAAARVIIREEERAAAIEAGTSAEKLHADAIQQTRDAYADAEKEVSSLRRGVEEYFDRVNELTNAQSSFEGSLDDMIDSLREVSKETGGSEYYLSEYAKTLNLDAEAGRDNTKALQEIGQATREHGLAVYEQTGVMAEGTAAIEANVAKLRDQLAQLGLNEQEIEAYIATAGLTPRDIGTTMLLYDDQAVSDLNYYRGELDKIPTQKVTDIIIRGVQGVAGVAAQNIANAIGFRAEGGPVSAGKPYIVGERGPELFTPGASGTITPNHALPAGGGNVHVHVEIEGREVAYALAKYEGSNG